MAAPIIVSSTGMDFTQRFQFTQAIAASPALAAETVIATLAPVGFGNLIIVSGVQLFGWVAYTVGTSGTAVTLRIRQDSVSGSVVGTSGALTKTAAQLYADDVQQVDTAPPTDGIYVMTMQVTAGAAISTVSKVMFSAFYF